MSASGGGMREEEKQSRPKAKQLRVKMTNAEKILWSHLNYDKLRGMRFRRQHPIGPFIADFACVPAKLVVEIDGETHTSPLNQEHDRRRERYLAAHGWRVIRVWNTGVYDNLAGALDMISAALPPTRSGSATLRRIDLPRRRGRKGMS